MELSAAKQIADELKSALAPACTRIEIAGGVRRGKPDVHDLELVCIPELSRKPRLELGRPAYASKTLLDAVLYDLEKRGRIVERVKDGDKYKQLKLSDGTGQLYGFKLDLFIVLPPAQWGVIFTIRTGPGSVEDNFSRWMVTQRSIGGALPSNLRVKEGAVWCGDDVIPTPEEQDFFAVLGLDWLEPSQRHARWNQLTDYEYRPAAVAPVVTPVDHSVAELMAGLGPGIHVTHRELNIK